MLEGRSITSGTIGARRAGGWSGGHTGRRRCDRSAAVVRRVIQRRRRRELGFPRIRRVASGGGAGITHGFIREARSGPSTRATALLRILSSDITSRDAIKSFFERILARSSIVGAQIETVAAEINVAE